MNPVFREIIMEAKSNFLNGNKFKIYARLFAEIIFQILVNSNENFLKIFELEQLPIFSSILFKQKQISDEKL